VLKVSVKKDFFGKTKDTKPLKMIIDTAPREIQLLIFGKLKVLDLVNLSETCHSLMDVARDPSLWKKLTLTYERIKNKNEACRNHVIRCSSLQEIVISGEEKVINSGKIVSVLMKAKDTLRSISLSPSFVGLSYSSIEKIIGNMAQLTHLSSVSLVRERLNGPGPTEAELVKCAASLAQHGLLGSVDVLALWAVDLSPVPAEQLTKLVTSVTAFLYIRKVSGCDLASLFTSIKCLRLRIYKQSLTREETLALVQAMEDGVEIVDLDGVELDMETLTAYRGQGVCGEVTLAKDDLAARIEELRTWARRINWSWRVYDEDWVMLTRP